ncbi:MULTISPECIES: SPOR domain-containing protein [Halomonadaceae]|jgi:DedD protein|uniref:DedD protein n=2 Tax=Vreelandella TaxID=3137766 RepID=A0A1N6GI93_9GAMM|nr:MULTISPECIES: SPOR domain-containing protein [Halomonas]MEE3268604.1 SPOR domain-containing protein [Pseudomonadota bacterium]MCC4286839.1 SPOR domain-containing protein [Halomonas meridiana]MCP1302685.1 SPOR domain-containing protein [Halomonas sp. R1t8]MCP1328812.1 SPOR domain-containing protein [Halomonas sp. R1t4]MDC8441717.1 SPOR domain-containing protein [Halomonas aquamarina]|tara:strand:- start:2134 stop:2829 length:696 start_codon:yes stop_codon:yes gene_type:complete
MKYGKTERISGIVILLALLAIVVPWLMSDPAPREERPQPTFVIEQPVDVERQDVPVPDMPDTIDTPAPSSPVLTDEALDEPIEEIPRAPQTDQVASSSSDEGSSSQTAAAEPSQQAPSQPSREPDSPPQEDPIAALVAANESRNSSASVAPSAQQQGEWAVQVGSFGDTANAQRISDQLSGEGFSVFQRARDNNLTTVLVGPYATSEDGEAAMALIKQRINVQGLLVRVRD